MRIGVVEAILEKLFQISAYQKPDYLARIAVRGSKLHRIGNLQARYVLHHDHVAARKLVMDSRNVHFRPGGEIHSEYLRIRRLACVVHLLEYSRAKLAERPVPINSSNQVGKAVQVMCYARKHTQIQINVFRQMRPLYFDNNLASIKERCPMHLAQACGGDGFGFELSKYLRNRIAEFSFNA